jgi:type I restriction enzyme S subunit
VFPKETVVIALYGATAGQVGILDIEAATNQAVFGIYPNGRFAPKFIFYLLLSRYEDLVSQAVGNAQPNLSGLKIKNIPIPSIALPEQRRIVGILDEAFDGIATAKANAEKNFQNARALFESHLQAVFTQRREGWVERPLGELATFRNGINFTKSSRGESVKIVGVKDFQKSFWAPLDNLESVTPDGALPDSDMLKENDLLFVRSNGNMELIGRCLLVGKVTDKITHSGFTIRARLNGGEARHDHPGNASALADVTLRT